MIERESSEQRSVPFENDQIFRTSRIECEVCDCIFGGNKIRVVQLSLKFLGVFGKDDAIASTSYLTWIHALTVYVKDSCARNHDILAPLHNALKSPNWHLTTRGIDHFPEGQGKSFPKHHFCLWLNNITSSIRWVAPDYFKALGITMYSGRTFFDGQAYGACSCRNQSCICGSQAVPYAGRILDDCERLLETHS
jgi:hypothetical protein